MGQTDLLRDSRDGDQFHYHWAARQALRLLRPGTDLVALVIEGVSPDDTASTGGDEVVDLAEYWGTPDLRAARRVVYRQLKHSTEAPDVERTSSYLKKSLIGFAKKYRSILDEHPSAADRVLFEFVSVPPLAASVKVALEDTATGRDALAPREAAYIQEQLSDSLTPAEAQAFSKQFIVRDGEPGLLQLRQAYRAEVASFLPGAAAAQDILLREMVATRASSIAGFHPVITRATVLSTLQVTEEMLLPAPNLIDAPSPLIELPQVAEVAQLVKETSAPVIAHATGGMGKSVLAATIGDVLPAGSMTLVYDCFGNGGYRRLSSRRHEHRQALLQLSNELAAKGLCDPVLSSDTASAGDYMRIFLERLATAASAVTASSPDAFLVVVIDAADNAVMAADDSGTPAFVPDLIREQLPPNARLLLLCRTERRDKLKSTAECVDLPLRGFDEEHSTAHLASRFGEVSEADGLEFHHLTDGNPRVQALVMKGAQSTEDVLQSLGEVKREGGDLFDDLMGRRLAKIREELGGEVNQVDHLCRALAALRPRIPVDVLATIADVKPAFIRSFATELGQSILLDQDTVQFRDEPTETWFRSEFRPSGEALVALIGAVAPLADVYPYLSASLPQLLYEAGMVRELVDLALSNEGLAAASDLERREIAHQRAQFALKAALRDGREVDAARLAWAAGELHAGETRRLELIKDNTDLAGEFLDAETIDSLLANRALAEDWPGSHLHIEGALLAATGTEVHLARSRLRSAQEWMRHWVRQAVARDEDHGVTERDIAELALGIFTVDGAAACVDFLARWSPPWVAYKVGRLVAGRLVDRNKGQELEELAVAAGTPERLQLAVVSVATEAGIPLSAAAVRRTIRMLQKHRAPLALGARHGTQESPLPIAWTLSLGIRHGLIDAAAAHDILARYLPATLGHDAGSQYERSGATEALLFAFTLDSTLRNAELDIESLAPAGVKKDREKGKWQRTRALVDFDSNVVPLARWTSLYVDSLTQSSLDTTALLVRYDALAAADFKTYSDYETPRLLINGISRAGIRLLSRLPASTEQRSAFAQWLTDNFRHLNWPTVVDVVRISSRIPELHQLGLDLARGLREAVETEPLPAEERCKAFLSLARATYAFDSHESRADFDRAVEITNRLGEDVYDRWRALGRIAEHACDAEDRPAQAYRLAQVAEGLQSYLGESHVAASVLPQIQRFSGPAAIAIASRWRDRRVASLDQLVRVLTDGDRTPIGAHPLWSLGMLPMGAGPSRVHLDSLGPRGDPARATAEVVVNEWLRPYGTTDTAEPAASAQPSDTADTVESDDPDDRAAPAGTETAAAAALFANFDLGTPAGWDEAVRWAEDDKRWVRSELLIDHAASLPPVKLRPMLQAVADASRVTLYDYGRLVQRLGARGEALPQAARKALEKLVDRLVERFAKQLTTHGYDPKDFAVVETVCGRTPTSVVGDALRHLGTVPELLTSSECYELVARLTGRAEPADNLAILRDAADSFSQVAPHDAGDGPFEQLPPPPADAESCVAAFVWCAAGDPAKETRWRAAHTIRLWLALGCTDLIQALARYANAETGVAPFVDARLVFYEKHALMWTLMAAARACDDDQVLARMAPLVPLLRRVVFDDPPNAVLHHSACHVLKRLNATGVPDLAPAELEQLAAINCPPVIHKERYGARPASTTTRLDATDHDRSSDEVREPGVDVSAAADEAAEGPQARGWTKADTRFSFFMDFEDHWCDRLGRAFGIADRRILELVDEVIVDRWNSPFRGRFEDDLRHELKLYGDGGTYAYKSSWPTGDDLDFYLSLHALYQVAGHLARHHSAFQDPGADQDDFAEWLEDHVPTRGDGRWISDRRDPVPGDLAMHGDPSGAIPPKSNRRDWLFDISSSRFGHILRPTDEWVTTHGYWTDNSWDRYETVDVSSALVDRATAPALVAALQTAPNLHAAHLPRESDPDHAVSQRHARYRLVDLVEDRHSREGIDTQDPNASGIAWPAPTPTAAVVAALGVTPDRDLREWVDQDGCQIRTSVWSNGSENERGSAGHRLQVRESALAQLLASEQRSLVVSVRIRRYLDSRYGSGDEDDVTESLQPYVRFILLRSDGSRLEYVD
jgi:hypothetical protein